MKLRDQTKFKLKRIILIGFISGVIGGLYIAFIQSITPILLLRGAFVGIGVSMSLSASEFFFLRNWMKRKSFTTAILVGTSYYLTVIIAVLFLSFAIFDGNDFTELSPIQLPGQHPPYIDILFSLLVSFLFVFLLQINELMGGRVLFSFFTGKYHKPIEEERIFMFLAVCGKTQFWPSLRGA